MQYKLAICRFPGNSQEHPASSGYVMHLIDLIARGQFPEVESVLPVKISDTPITMSRNRAAKNALDRGADYILMIDSDMDPDLYVNRDGLPFFKTAWKFMMSLRKQEEEYRTALRESYEKLGDGPEDVGSAIEDQSFDVFPPATIAAPYCGPPPSELCYVFEWKDKADETPAFKLAMIDRDSAAIRSGIQQVAALPTGLILYDARVFARLPRPWFDYEWTDEYQVEKATTEDVFQTRNAAILGMPQYVAWDCWAGHVKLKTVGKPTILHPDLMSEKLRGALANPPAGARLTFIREDVAASEPGTVAGDE